MHLSKLLVPAVLGLSLVSVTAFVVYYILKKEEDEEDDTSTKVKTSRVNTIEVNVPKRIMPALIGRGGSNIKDMENKSGAKINMKAFSDKDYDVCIIRGGNNASQMAEMLVRDFIRQQPEIVEDVIEVPGWACGRIIGTGGENINDISHRCGAKLKVESAGANSAYRCIKIRGTLHQIEVAKGLVKVFVAQETCRREIEESNRSPRHALPSGSTASMSVPPPPSGQCESLPGDAKHVKYKRPDISEEQIKQQRPVVVPRPVLIFNACISDLKIPKEWRSAKILAVLKTVDCGGSPIEVVVSAVSSPSRFWVQFVRPAAQLRALVDEMTEYYGKRDNREAHALSHVSVGQVVAAVFRYDGCWYRARVHAIVPNEFDPTKQVADLFFVDYGDSEFVSLNELYELRADLLGLRFQAMECFLAGVQPTFGEEWPAATTRRFEELVDVANWKILVSRTCTYKKTATGESEKEKEIPGIKLIEVTELGELDIGGVLIAENIAIAAPARPTHLNTAAAPFNNTRATPFGDLGNSRVLGMVGTNSARASSLPKDHNQNENTTGHDAKGTVPPTERSIEEILVDRKKLCSLAGSNRVRLPRAYRSHVNSMPRPRSVLTTSKSHASGLEKSDEYVGFPPGVYPNVKWEPVVRPTPPFLIAEKESNGLQGFEEPTMKPIPPGMTLKSKDIDSVIPQGVYPNVKWERIEKPSQTLINAEKEDGDSQTNGTVHPPRSISDELKANINRIDSHHSNLETVGDNKSFASRLDEDSSQFEDRKNI